MKTTPARPWTRALAVLLLAAWPGRALGILGVGDIVFDPANTAQTINVLRSTQQQFDRLGQVLGVSTRQFDQLVSLAAAIGSAGEAAAFSQPLTAGQLQAAVQSDPGLQGTSLDALFNTSGQLDAFMGVPPGQWALSVENPDATYGAILSDPAISRTGGEAPAQPAASYAQWYAARSAEDRGNQAAQAAADLSNLLAADWLGGARRRRVNIQALAAGTQDAQAKAGLAQTIADQQHAQAQLSAGTNAILLETAAQNADAAETTVRAIGAQERASQERDEAERNAGELRLDAGLWAQ